MSVPDWRSAPIYEHCIHCTPGICDDPSVGERVNHRTPCPWCPPGLGGARRAADHSLGGGHP